MLTIILSADNENETIQSLDELMWFIVNELESANIGALVKIEDVTPE
jgi:flagellin-specific chaperone FliS